MSYTGVIPSTTDTPRPRQDEAAVSSAVLASGGTTPRLRFVDTADALPEPAAVMVWPQGTPLLAELVALFADLGLRVASHEQLPAGEPGSPLVHRFDFSTGDFAWDAETPGLLSDAFEAAAERKWLQIKDFVRPGRILDIGCATGATLQLADRDPRFHESDLIGVEVARHLFAECEHKKEQGLFSNPNVYFYQRNMLGSAVFPPRSIDTTLTLALTHEIWSYADGSRPDTVQRFADALFAHTAPDGVWINSDVCGPDEPERPVVLRLDDSDGENPDGVAELEALADPAAYVGRLSTRARFFQFAHDFRRNARVPFAYDVRADGLVLRLADAMDFLTRKDYVDNWLSETHEQFCGLNFSGWSAIAERAGFTIDPASNAWRNDWVIENRIAPVATITTPDGDPITWPVTHQLLIARR